MSATLRYNPEHTTFEVTVGENTWAQEIEDGDESLILHHERGAYVVTFDDSELEGLEPNCVYQLVKVGTTLQPEGEFEIDAEEDVDVN